MGRALVAAIAIYVLIVVLMAVFQRRLLYMPSTALPDRVRAGLAEMREVTLETADGLRLLSWYAEPRPGRPTMLYLHGNAGNIEYRSKVRVFLEQGLGVLLVGYRGYGGNRGAPSEAGLLADGHAALAFLESEGVPHRRIVLYGESLGSGVAVPLAAEAAAAGRPVGAVVLEAPFTSIPDVAQRHYWYVPARWLVVDRFDSAARIDRIAAPLLVLHGERDRVTPPTLGRALYDRAAEPKRLRSFPLAGHVDLFEHGAGGAVIEALSDWGLIESVAVPG